MIDEGNKKKMLKKKILSLSALILLSLLLGGCRHPGAELPAQKEITIPERRAPLEELRYLPGEVLVRFQEELTPEEKTALLKKWGLEIKEKVLLTDIYRLKLPAGMTVREAVEKLKQQEEVKQAQPNYIFRIRDNR